MSLVLILLALLGAPLFIVIGAFAFLFYPDAEIPNSTMLIEGTRVLTNPVLLAIPFFTMAGYFMAESKTPQRIVKCAQAIFGWLPAGFAVVTLLACAFFTAFTGASGVTIVALGGLLYPILIKEHYPERFTLGILTASGSLGLLFPPSLPIILYGIISGVEIDDLFVAGIVPGFLLIVILTAYSVFVWKKADVERMPFEWKNVLPALRGVAWELPLPIIILGGIYGGIFTATDASIITAAYVFIIEVFIYRDIDLFKDVPRVMRESLVLVGGILVILAAAAGFTNFIIDAQIPDQIFEFIEQYIDSPLLFLFALNIFLLIVGCIMDIFSAIIVVVPLIIPIAQGFHIDPVHLGIIFLTNLEIGYLTPPVGINLFIASFRFRRPVIELYSASVRFLVLLLIALVLITYIPFLSLGLLKLTGMYTPMP